VTEEDTEDDDNDDEDEDDGGEDVGEGVVITLVQQLLVHQTIPVGALPGKLLKHLQTAGGELNVVCFEGMRRLGCHKILVWGLALLPNPAEFIRVLRAIAQRSTRSIMIQTQIVTNLMGKYELSFDVLVVVVGLVVEQNKPHVCSLVPLAKSVYEGQSNSSPVSFLEGVRNEEVNETHIAVLVTRFCLLFLEEVIGSV